MTKQLIEIRVPFNLAEKIKNAVQITNGHESIVFGLVSHAKLENRTLLLVKQLCLLPEADYIESQDHGAMWSGAAMLLIINEAIEKNLGILMFHEHGGNGKVGLSTDDKSSALRLLPTFQNLIPTRPHGSIVLGNKTITGMVIMPDQDDYSTNIELKWLNAVIQKQTGELAEVKNLENNENDKHFSQNMLIGSDGHGKIKNTKIAVVGLSGGGSHVIQQLAHMGVGEIIAIDPDRVEGRNHSRLIGMESSDVFWRRYKTSVMKRMVKRIDKKIKFTEVKYVVSKQEAINAIKEADIIIGCVDNFHARQEIQELSWRYLIPYIDIGILIKPNTIGSDIAIGGNVGVFIPGRFCQWCSGDLTSEALDSETGGRTKSYFQGTTKQAQVISFNGIVASQAVSEVLQMITGFASEERDIFIKKFDGVNGTLQNWGVSQNLNCSLCQFTLASGDPVWKKA